MNKKFCILTDSSCSKELLHNVADNIQILPLNIIDDGQDFVDNLEPLQFIELLKTQRPLKTSTTPMGVMFETFERLSAQYDLIIYLSISSHLSSQFSQAQITVQELDLKDKVWVFDSQSAAVGLSHVVLAVHNLLTTNPDATYAEVEQLVQIVSTKTLSWFTCNEIKRLINSGRGGRKLLNYFGKLIRPIVRFDGKNHLLSIAPTLNGAINKMIKLVAKKIGDQKIDIQSIIVMQCSENRELVTTLCAKLAAALDYEVTKIQIFSAPSVVACHTGLDTFGVGVLLK